MLDTSVVPPKQQTKPVLITALISAVSTIAVSFIAILPMIMKDRMIPKDELHLGNALGRKADPAWRISGSVLDDATDKPVSAQLFLLKSDSIRPTDDSGKFVFDQVPTGAYLIQVEVGDSQGKRSSRYLIERLTDREAVLRPQAGGPWIKVRMEPATQE